MKGTKRSADKFSIVLMTAPDLATARKLSKVAVQSRLAACANIIPRIESCYWWDGKVQQGAEVLVLLKTTTSRLKTLKALVLSKHPYEVPEFITLKVDRGNKEYLAWWSANLC